MSTESHVASQEANASAAIHANLRHFVTQQVTDVELPGHWTVDRATEEIARAIDLPERNAENVKQGYELFVRDGDGRSERLPPSALLRDSVREGDELEPLPEIIPGAE
jgi:hypothetical protein